MDIRREDPNDYNTIYQFVQTAFATAKVKDGDEQDFVNNLRRSDNYIPQLALVAEEEGKIIGHIMLTRTWVEDDDGQFTALLLTHLAVALEYRNQGIGTKLVQIGLKMAADMGYKAVFLAGDRGYYHRFGFVPARQYGIKCSLDVPEELIDNIMVCELVPNALAGVRGTVKM